eukprot:scaffold153884_cov39-Prasinocladus_malaysianus.AAC.2
MSECPHRLPSACGPPWARVREATRPAPAKQTYPAEQNWPAQPELPLSDDPAFQHNTRPRLNRKSCGTDRAYDVSRKRGSWLVEQIDQHEQN